MSGNRVKKKDRVILGVSLLTDHDIYLFKEGNHFGLYEKLGSHLMTVDGAKGTLFAVWAPNAAKVSVIGDFNAWNNDSHPLAVRHDGSGIWEGFIPGVLPSGSLYKYHIVSRHRPAPGRQGRSLCDIMGDAAPNILDGLGPRKCLG